MAGGLIYKKNGIFWDGEALATEGRETRGERIWRNIAADAG